MRTTTLPSTRSTFRPVPNIGGQRHMPVSAALQDVARHGGWCDPAGVESALRAESGSIPARRRRFRLAESDCCRNGAFRVDPRDVRVGR
eukprot:2700548-Prymnesium_polylepis.2